MTKHRVMGLLLALTIILSGAGPSIGKEAGDFMIRLRGIGMIPQESGTTDAIGGNASLDNDFAPEVDFTYFLTDNIAFELIAAITKHDAAVKNTTLGRDVALGDVRVLPPTLTLQYHFFTKEKISPYLGAGINYSVFFDDDIGNDPAVNKVDYTNGFGAAIQPGIDCQFHKN
jgi:outer membrane protein